MPGFNVPLNPEGTTREEFRKLLELRREALDKACTEPPSLIPTPVQWRWGMKAHIRVQGRDKDGSLLAHIVVTGPRQEVPYVRKVRLVSSKALPFELRRGLRES